MGLPDKEDRSIRTGATLGAAILAVYVFLLTSRVLDMGVIGYLHIPMTLFIVLMAMALAKGSLQTVFQSSKVVKYYCFFTIWVLLSFPFSAWRGGSTPFVQSQLQSFIILVIIVQLVKTKRDWERVATAYAVATLTAAVMSFFMGVSIEGRVALFNGFLADPNAFALFMVVGLPFWWLKASRSSGIKKLFYYACTAPIYPALARAGSRSGMLAMLVLFAVTFYFANGSRKVLIILLGLVGGVAAFVALPDYLKVRYMTFFVSNASDNAMQGRLDADVQSSEGRRMLLIQSVRMTFQHPVLGVGPGVFNVVAWDERKATLGPKAGAALVSHNTYTQVSSEIGLPGFFLFVGTVFLCFRYTLVDYRNLSKKDPDFAVSGRYLFSSLAALSLGIFFLSVGYTHLLTIIFALAASLHFIVESYLQGNTMLPGAATSLTQRIQTGIRARQSGNSPAAQLSNQLMPPQLRRPPRRLVRRSPALKPSSPPVKS